MRLPVLLVTIGVASAAYLPQHEQRASNLVVSADDKCRAAFHLHDGFCLYSSDPEKDEYQQSVDTCTAFGVFAPSIHSEEDLNFWISTSGSWLVSEMFWLHVYCPKAGKPYSWIDGSPTDYLGPRGEFGNCDTQYGVQLHMTGLVRLPTIDAQSTTLCAYQQQMPALLPTEAVATATTKGVNCREGFLPYKGFCVYASDPAEYTYQEAVDVCAAKGASAPSMHSTQDLVFWYSSLYTLTPTTWHFWLDAYCPKTGELYIWRDGRTTDYLGEDAELLSCSKEINIQVHPGGMERQSSKSLACALCAYRQQSTLPTEPAPIASTATSVPDKSTTLPPNENCRDQFVPYNGFCVYSSDPAEYTYQQAVDNCAAKGAFAPSMHSTQDLVFWYSALYALTPFTWHFWLDAYCPKTGENYIWRDGSFTDYLGENAELSGCSEIDNIQVHPGGMERQSSKSLACALCAYRQQTPATLPTEPAPTAATTKAVPDTPVTLPSSSTADLISSTETTVQTSSFASSTAIPSVASEKHADCTITTAIASEISTDPATTTSASNSLGLSTLATCVVLSELLR